MLTFSIAWVVLAAAISMIAIAKKSTVASAENEPRQQPRESSNSFVIFGLVYGIVLLPGVFYVGKFLVSGL